jgi:hypothetical protein
MIDSRDSVFDRLISIQKKYSKYFHEHDLDIFSVIFINWNEPVSVHVTAEDIPADLKHDIENIFYIL